VLGVPNFGTFVVRHEPKKEEEQDGTLVTGQKITLTM